MRVYVGRKAIDINPGDVFMAGVLLKYEVYGFDGNNVLCKLIDGIPEDLLNELKELRTHTFPAEKVAVFKDRAKNKKEVES